MNKENYIRMHIESRTKMLEQQIFNAQASIAETQLNIDAWNQELKLLRQK